MDTMTSKPKLIALLLLVAFVLPANATTTNPVELVIDGAFTINVGVSETTQLFLERGKDSGNQSGFWVRVVDDPGIQMLPGGDPIVLPKTIYIKYFTVDRYIEVKEAVKKIKTFGVVDPYIDGAVICDGPNSTIRYRKKTVIMAYNCGADAPPADDATFRAESLIKALRSETVAEPDMVSTIP